MGADLYKIYTYMSVCYDKSYVVVYLFGYLFYGKSYFISKQSIHHTL